MGDQLRRTDARPSIGEQLMAAARFGTPAAPSVHVPRPRLSATLARAENLPLVVVSAPAGTGKTAVVADWVRAEPPGTVCWVAFEDGEVSFWDGVLESLRRQGLGVPTGWSVPLDAGLGHQRLAALAGLIVGASERLTIVVDGYELASRELAREIDHLLGHTLGRLCFVFVGRVDPILPLYRFRLADSLLEVRAPDLAFSDEEAAQLLGSAGVKLDPAAVHELNHRLGGWAAGLRFAARALAARDDADAYSATVVEQTADINAYLVGEVLDAQPPDVRRFLLDTCVPDMFSTDLAEMVGGASARRTMTDLVERQAFVEPVPGLPDCYRYYPFFRSLLLAVLSYESPDRLVETRRIASAWYRQQGRHVASLGQLARIGAWGEMATQLVGDGLVGRLLLEDRGGALGGLVRRMPAQVDDPAVRVLRAAEALRHGEAGRERCARDLAAVRRALRSDQADRQLMAAVTVTDALRACLTDPSTRAAELVAQAERLVAEMALAPPAGGGAELETVVAFVRGVVALRLGDLAEARDRLAVAATLAVTGASPAFLADCLGRLAVADALWGELAGAVRHAEEALTVASRAGLGHLDVPSAHVALAWIGVERCDAGATAEHVTAARSSRMLAADPFCHGLVEAAVAVLEQSTGQAGAAVDRLEAAAAASAGPDPWVADLLRAEACKLKGPANGSGQALEVIELVQHPDRHEVPPLGAQVRALLVEASQTARDRSPGQAGSALSQALRLAATEHLRRPFRESDLSVRRLLMAHPRLAQEHDWLHVGGPARPSRPPEDPSGLPILVEPLTAKELEVLGHLAELLTTDEIAQVMLVSVNTVRTHIRHILAKLGVNRRNAAIRRARELGVLDD